LWGKKETKDDEKGKPRWLERLYLLVTPEDGQPGGENIPIRRFEPHGQRNKREDPPDVVRERHNFWIEHVERSAREFAIGTM